MNIMKHHEYLKTFKVRFTININKLTLTKMCFFHSLQYICFSPIFTTAGINRDTELLAILETNYCGINRYFY